MSGYGQIYVKYYSATMDFLDLVGDMKERLYERIPQRSDIWQDDVWENSARPGIARQYQQLLRTHDPESLLTDAGKAALEEVRMDMFGIRADGKHLHGVPDSIEASVARFVPFPDETPPDEVIEAFDICIQQTGYKLYKWAQTSQLVELADLCSRIPHIHVPSYETQLKSSLSLAGLAAAYLDCDAETKPNFATLEHRIRLYRLMLDTGERFLRTLESA